jgi:hypothetical protein
MKKRPMRCGIWFCTPKINPQVQPFMHRLSTGFPGHTGRLESTFARPESWRASSSDFGEGQPCLGFLSAQRPMKSLSG